MGWSDLGLLRSGHCSFTHTLGNQDVAKLLGPIQASIILEFLFERVPMPFVNFS